MKKPRRTLLSGSLIAVSLFLTRAATGQGYDEPLSIKGLDHYTLHSAASRGAGGITVGVMNDPGLMFTNPASLQSLTGIQLSVGAVGQSTSSAQVQHYSPLKYYSNFSLLMEGLTDRIPDPDTLLQATNPGDTVQRAFDAIVPNWSRSTNSALPVQIMLGVPFAIGETEFVAGAGFVQYADLNHFYQNNNVLSPAIGSDRPVPIELPASDSTPVRTDWSSFLRLREGSMQGYGAALSASVSEEIALGLSGLILTGHTDDMEQRIARGRLTFYKEWFRLDSVSQRTLQSGSSEYRGAEFTLSGIFRGRYLSVGLVVKPPMKIIRTFTSVRQTDSAGVSSSVTENGEDAVRLPWRGTVGISLSLLENLHFGLEYEIRSFASAVYTAADGKESNPWLSGSVVHIGAEYFPLTWLALRAGVRGQTEVFEPAGNPIIGEPVTSSVYSLGCGFFFAGVRLNVTYEYAPMEYQDMWQTNVNLNSETSHRFMASLSYELPFAR